MKFDLKEYIIHHVSNGYHWQLPFLPPIHLPQPLTLHALMILICFFSLIFIFCVLYQKKARVPGGLTNLLEVFIVFIREDIVYPALGEKDGRRMMPLFCTFFFFILFLNLMGLIPLFAAATSNLSVTIPLAVTTFCFMMFGSIYKNGLVGFLKHFVPSGIPIVILPLVVLLEVLGFFIRPMALFIRLTANMFGGHITMAVFISLAVLFFGVMTLPIAGLVLVIYLLEVLVAFVQAYVFTLLSALFIGQTYHTEH